MRLKLRTAAVLLLPLFVGCTQYHRIMGEDHEGSGADHPSSRMVVSELSIPSNGTLSFIPSIDADEAATLDAKLHLIGSTGGLFTSIDRLASEDIARVTPYFVLNGSTAIIYNHSNYDTVELWFVSSHLAGYHTVQ